VEKEFTPCFPGGEGAVPAKAAISHTEIRRHREKVSQGENIRNSWILDFGSYTFEILNFQSSILNTK
jgi:hypothetical protein